MTSPTANKPSPTSKATNPSKSAPVQEKLNTPPVAEKPVAENPVTEKPQGESRIPDVLRNSILQSICRTYLEAFDEISKYNKDVLKAEKSEWTSSKIMDKARELANPTDANIAPNAAIKTALTSFEKIQDEFNRARKSLLEQTAKELGIDFSTSTERNADLEKPLKEKRASAIEVGKQLSAFSKVNTDPQVNESVIAFLTEYPLPSVGREQARTFGADEKATPKYRVNITVTNVDGDVLLEKPGFTQTALALTKFYERGKALKADALREKWEAAGNTVDNTVKDPVEFEDNGLHFKIAKK